MALSDTALVDLTQAKNFIRVDSATSLHVDAEYVGMGDGETVAFALDYTPLSGSLRVYVSGTLQVEGTDYTLSSKTVTFASAPDADAPVTASYDKTASSDTFEDFDDSQLEAIIAAATNVAEHFTGRAFVQRTITENHRGDGSSTLRLNKTPVASITSVTLDDDELTVDTDYTDDSYVGRLTRIAWDAGEQIAVVYVAGYGADRAATQALVPEAVTAVLLIVADMWENRGDRVGAENISGIGSVSYNVPSRAEQILQPLRRNLF